MEILRVFNNNVVLAKDASGEKIVTGRGIGFQARPGMEVDSDKIARIFLPADGRDPDHVAQLLAEIPHAHLKLAAEAIEAAQLGSEATHNLTLLLALADHIGAAVARAAAGQIIEYPLYSEVSTLYPAEYQQAQLMLAHINAQLRARKLAALPSGEAIAISLHLVNAGFATGNLSFTYSMTGVLQQLIDVIESQYGSGFHTDTVSVGRFITHVRYLFVRIKQHQQLKEQYSVIGEAIRQADPPAYQCALRLAAVIELRLGATLSEDEISYLTMHVSRIAHSASGRTSTPETLKTAPPNPDASAHPDFSTPSIRKDNPMITRTATIGSSVGLHARPASLFTAAAAEYDFDITISLDGEEADAASILEVMTLGAKHGDVVTLAAEDDAAAAALDELAAMLERDLDAE